MARTLIIHWSLGIGGGEKLTYELARFAKANNIEPTILVPENLQAEYYDSLFEKENIKVVRVPIHLYRKIRHPVRKIKAAYWKYKLKYFANSFDSIHFISLYTADKYYDSIRHDKRSFWHIGNVIQYPDGLYPFRNEIFENNRDTLVYLNDFQKQEIREQYKSFKLKEVNVKLFLNER